MDVAGLPGGTTYAPRLTLCFRTEAQARALVNLAAALATPATERVQALYCRPPGFRPADGLAAWLDELTEDLGRLSGQAVSVRTTGQSLEPLLADLAVERDQVLLVAADEDDSDAHRWSLRLLQRSPVAAVMSHGAVAPDAKRILVGVDGGITHEATTAVASDLADWLDAEVVAVTASSAQQRAMAAVRHLDRHAVDAVRQIDQVGSMARALFDSGTYRGMVQGNSRDAALLSAARKQEPDVVVAGLQRGGLGGEFASARIPHMLLRRSPAPVVLVNVPVRPAMQRVTACMHRVFDVLPTLPPAQRASIYSQVRRSARGDTDFLFMIVASTSLAALGLRLDSAVVIIGAMLVAPLMSPIVGVGLAVAQGDGRLLAMATRSVARGIALAVGAAFLLGLVLPSGEVTGEMLKRTNPTLLDLGVAVASGCAGAYALSRKGVSSSLPGVAIAVSLVPPLATTGMALAMREPAIASGSFLLFLVNLAAVAATASLMFVWMGFSPEVGHVGRRATFGKGVAGLGAMLVAVTLPLMWAAIQLGSEDSTSAQIESALTESVEEVAGARVVSFEIAESGEGLAVSADVEVAEPVATNEVEAIHGELERVAGRRVKLTIRSEIVAVAGVD